MARPREWTPDLDLLRRRHAGAELEELALDYGTSVSTLSRYLKANEQVMDDLAAAEQQAPTASEAPQEPPAPALADVQPPGPKREPEKAPQPVYEYAVERRPGYFSVQGAGIGPGRIDSRLLRKLNGLDVPGAIPADELEERDRWAEEMQRRRAVRGDVPQAYLEMGRDEYNREAAKRGFPLEPDPAVEPAVDPLQCSRCGEVFRQGAALANHVRDHGDEDHFGTCRG